MLFPSIILPFSILTYVSTVKLSLFNTVSLEPLAHLREGKTSCQGLRVGLKIEFVECPYSAIHSGFLPQREEERESEREEERERKGERPTISSISGVSAVADSGSSWTGTTPVVAVVMTN